MTIGKLGSKCISKENVEAIISDGNAIIGIDQSFSGCGVSYLDENGFKILQIKTPATLPPFYRMQEIKKAIMDSFNDYKNKVSFIVMEAPVYRGFSAIIMYSLAVFLSSIGLDWNIPVFYIHNSKLRKYAQAIFNVPSDYEKHIKPEIEKYGFSKDTKIDGIDSMLLSMIYSKYAGKVFTDKELSLSKSYLEYLEPYENYVVLPVGKITRKIKVSDNISYITIV